MTCRRCDASVAPGDRFCSECGARLAAPEPPGAHGRAEAAGSGLAGQTDPGVTHASNQDAFVLSGPAAGGDGSILVLCDGVSNSQTPDLAAATASRTAHDVLSAGGAMREAIERAHQAVCALPFDRQAALDPPATTIVAAQMQDGQATIGWLGDSRAYFLGGSGRVLTRDHSWLAAALDRGEMTEAEVLRDPRAHALLHCLGTTDFTAASPCPEPGIITLAPRDGWLLLCSDGLWNYAPTASALAQAASQGLQGGDAADLCARLVAFARAAGGHDNITAVAMRFGGG